MGSLHAMKWMLIPAASLVALLSVQSSASAGERPPDPIAITHVAVIDTQGGPTRPDMTVLIRDGRIAAVEPADALMLNAVVVDGRGKFLIPGLWDAHVHLSWATASALPVLVANGITAVRDCGSDLTEIDGWRSQIAAGLRIGPQILRAGPILNGKSFNRYQLETGTPDQARGIVRTLKWLGVDFIKVHRRVPRDAYFAIMDEAKRQGLQVVGHIPMTVRPEEAADAGQFIEHEETLFEGTFSESLTAAQLPEAIHGFLASGAADSLFARFVRDHTPVTSTLTAWRYLVAHPDTSWLSDPRMRYVARSQKDAARRAAPMSADDQALLRRTAAAYADVLAALHRAGVTLLAGTDLAGPRIPGFTLHDELVTLVEAGLTPLQALRAATLTPSKVFNKEADFGSVTVGKRADLVLLDADPLADIHNTQRIAAVVLGGKLFRRRDLDALLRAAEEAAAKN
jgi:imidazolonepropionase-like amidohydrolase